MFSTIPTKASTTSIVAPAKPKNTTCAVANLLVGKSMARQVKIAELGALGEHLQRTLLESGRGRGGGGATSSITPFSRLM